MALGTAAGRQNDDFFGTTWGWEGRSGAEQGHFPLWLSGLSTLVCLENPYTWRGEKRFPDRDHSP